MTEVNKIRPDREDLDDVREKYCAEHNCTRQEYDEALSDDGFAAHQYRLAQARKLLRLLRRGKDGS